MRNPSAASSSSTAKPQLGASSSGLVRGDSSPSSGAANTTPCCTEVGLKRGPWTPQEDELLSTYIKREGEGRWRTLPKKAGLLRCGKSCRLRWMNYLRPCVKRGRIAPDEEDLILRLHRLLGNRWALIAGRIPGRTDNEIKNYWNTHLSKKLISQGIDPRTHKPLMDHNETKASSSKGNHGIIFPCDPSSNVYPPVVENAANGGGIEHDYQYINAVMTEGNVNIGNTQMNGAADGDGCGVLVDLRGSQEGLSNEDDVEIEDINYCNDEVFSSFLNSLINEDVQQQPNSTNSDALESSTFGPGWDMTYNASSFEQDDHSKKAERASSKASLEIWLMISSSSIGYGNTL